MFEKIAQAGDDVDYAQALRAAQHQVRSNPKYTNPYYWAAFTLTGSHWENTKFLDPRTPILKSIAYNFTNTSTESEIDEKKLNIF